jgi:hypothetical protein
MKTVGGGFFFFFFLIFYFGWLRERKVRRNISKNQQVHRADPTIEVFELVDFQISTDAQPGVKEAPPRAFPNTFGDGVVNVGVDISPGTYCASGQPPFHTIWQRLSDFTENGVISAGDAIGPCMVTIAKTDRGFQSQFSGGWTRID